MFDPQRPRYHFLPAANWLNDPNGLIQWGDAYHLFYQYNPHGAWWGTIHWGHAVSDDLLHWRELPLALTPTPGTADEDGCWSGCLVDDAGTPTIIYTGSRDGQERPCLATGDASLATWRPWPGNPVIPDPPAGSAVVGFRDPYVWREGDQWLMALGSGFADQGGAILLYASRDLRAWDYLHPLYAATTAHEGAMWECPSFFPLGEKYVLIISLIPSRQVIAYIGTYQQHRFVPEQRQLVDGGAAFYAPQVFRDNAGRALMFGWIKEERSEAAQRAAGWSGAMSLPRVLTLTADGGLGMTPAPEVAALTTPQLARATLTLMPTAPHVLPPLPTRQARLDVTFTAPVAACGLTLSDAPTTDALLTLRYEPLTGDLVVHGGDTPDAAMAVGLRPDESLQLRVFLDGSTLEVFANARVCLTKRYYSASSLPPVIQLFAEKTPLTTQYELCQVAITANP